MKWYITIVLNTSTDMVQEMGITANVNYATQIQTHEISKFVRSVHIATSQEQIKNFLKDYQNT